jgi:hypothetical protein
MVGTMELRDALSLFALAVSIISVCFSIIKGRYDLINGVKPVLVFVYDQATGWEVRNIGAGPALNVVIAEKGGGAGSHWVNPVRIPPLKKDGSFGLDWAPHTNVDWLAATYDDIGRRSYTTTCGDDLNVISEGNHLPVWRESAITAKWKFQKVSS